MTSSAMYHLQRMSAGTPHVQLLSRYLAMADVFAACSRRADFPADERFLRTLDALCGRNVGVARTRKHGFLRLVMSATAPGGRALAGPSFELAGAWELACCGAHLRMEGQWPPPDVAVRVLVHDAATDARDLYAMVNVVETNSTWLVAAGPHARSGRVRVTLGAGACALLRCPPELLDAIGAQLMAGGWVTAWVACPSPLPAGGHADCAQWNTVAAGPLAGSNGGRWSELSRGEQRPPPPTVVLDTLAGVQDAMAPLTRARDTARLASVVASPMLVAASDYEAHFEEEHGFFDRSASFFGDADEQRQDACDTATARQHISFDWSERGVLRVAWDRKIPGYFFGVAADRPGLEHAAVVVFFVPGHRWRCYRLVVAAVRAADAWPPPEKPHVTAHRVSSNALHDVERSADEMGADATCLRLRSLFRATSGPSQTLIVIL